MGDEQITAALVAMRQDVVDVREDVASVRERVTRVEARSEAVDRTMTRIEGRFDATDGKLDRMSASYQQGIGGARVANYITTALVGLASALATLFIGGRHIGS